MPQSPGESEVVRRYAFTTHGQSREVTVVKTNDASMGALGLTLPIDRRAAEPSPAFQVFLDDRLIAIADCAVEEMLLPVEIPVPGGMVQGISPRMHQIINGMTLQGLLSQYILSVNEVTIEPWWTQEHGDIPDRVLLEVADFQMSSPSDIIAPSVRNQPKAPAKTPQGEARAELAQRVIPSAGMPEQAHLHGSPALAHGEPVGLAGFGSLIDDAEVSLARDSWRSPEAVQTAPVGHLRNELTEDIRPFEDAQQIPEFVNPRQQCQKASASSWYWCSGAGGKIPGAHHPRDPDWASKTDEDLGCPCCRPNSLETQVPERPIAKMWNMYCFDLGLEIFGEA